MKDTDGGLRAVEHPTAGITTKSDAMEQPANATPSDQACVYRIDIRDRLRPEWSGWFEDMAISVWRDETGASITTLTGALPDQAALHGVLARIRDLGLTLLAVQIVRKRV